VTVAAVILAASPEGALADADGLPSVRRIADVAWSGGATPIVVVSFDPVGSVSTALAGAPVTLAEPASSDAGPAGPAAQMARGVDVALEVIGDTDACLIWPARMTWVGPETITSLVEAHGVMADHVLRPSFEGTPGWPALVPLDRLTALRSLDPTLMPEDIVAALAAGGPIDALDLGDPGTTHDRDTARADLPPYVGPVEPAAGHVHEWGAEVADLPDDLPLEGPSLAPYAPAQAGEAEGI
jgi:CTP:molybdopterin cytidylyltransferase MocA